MVPSSERLERDLVGRKLDPYHIVRLIGSGGMCLVYLAQHLTLQRRVAIKTLRPECLNIKEVWARFFNEARATSAISHPGVVQVHHDGILEPERIPYIIMEFLDGESLWERYVRQGQAYDPAYIGLLRQIAAAMVAVHAQEIVHRDLKPQNIMLVPDPEIRGGLRAKVVDFGIAKIKARHYLPADPRLVNPEDIQTILDSVWSIIGTPLYMSPEQCSGAANVTDRSDVFSLGVMAYRLIAGRSHIQEQAMGDIIDHQIRRTPPPLAAAVPWLPRELTGLVHQMLDKDPRKRPSMAQVAERLATWEDDPRRFPPSDRPTRVSRASEEPTGVRPPRGEHRAAWKVALPVGVALTLLSALAALIGLR